jgi:xanthine phosphoribosyltransferase
LFVLSRVYEVQFFKNTPVVERREAAYRNHQVSKVSSVIGGFDTWREDYAPLLNHRVELGDTMKELEDRILRDGKNLGGGILKVDSFVNHQVDPLLMDACGREFARRFASVHATKVLTAEISGIAPALTTAIHLGLPVVYARKHKPITMPDQVFLTLAPSHTKGRTVELIVSPEYLANNERVLIIDDFLASGQTILGLVRLAETSGSKIVGIGALIEKSFEGGRDVLESLGVPVESLACIAKMEDGKIEFRK